MTMTSRFALALVAASLFVLGCSAAQAADEAVWSVAGKQVLRLHGANAEKRVDTLDGRLTEILSAGDGKLNGEDIKIHSEKTEVSIEVRGMLLVTVTSTDATANKTTKDGLAKKWLTNLRNTLPQLAPRENRHGA